MDQRSQYLIQILEKIGAPLLGAAADVSARAEKTGPKDQDDLARNDAQRVAELLAKSIQISIDLGQKMDLANQPDQGESFRLALAALAGETIAAQYRALGRVPGDAEMARLMTAFEAVLTFSENFIPSPENVERLRQMKAQGQSVDPPQTILQSIQAFVPVIDAIGAFSFGQPEKKLIQDVSERLLSHMYELTQKIFGNSLDETARPFAELALLRALALLYAESHGAETRRLMGLSEELRQQQSMSLDPVWAAFEARAAMLEVLSISLVPGAAAQGGGSSKAPIQSAPQQQAPASPPPQQPQQSPAQKPAIFGAAPQAPASPPPSAPPAGGNPLSMFAKKPEGSTPPPAAPPSPPPASPPSAPPAQNPPSQSDQNPSGGGPMSFFKKPNE